MKLRKEHILFLSLLTAPQLGSALDCSLLGSEGYCLYTTGTISGADAVQFARDPGIGTNLIFSNLEFVEAASSPEAVYDYGIGSKELVAGAANLSSNMTMTAAKTDPRSVGFLGNSVAKSIEALHSEDPGNLGNLDKKQLGDSTLRFIEGQSIEPNIGQYQTTDNEQAFQSTFDNIALGEAEQALYVGDRANAINFFNNKQNEFQESQDKQAQATDYQKEGILRNKQTAEDFRDFFSFKSQVSQSNLAMMPTPQSLVNNCKKNTSPNEDLMGTYNKIISPDEIEFYSLKPIEYNFDFCESYVHNEQHSLIKNLPVHEKLQNIITDSEKMAHGLNEVAQTLGDTSLGAFELQKYLSQNESWQNLGERQKAWQECAAKNCLDELKQKVESVTTYPGFEKDLQPSQQHNRALVRSIIESKSIPDELKNSSYSARSTSLATNSANLHLKLDKLAGTDGSSSDTTNSSYGDHLKAHLVSGRAPANSATHQLTSAHSQYQMGSNKALYSRDESGVLVGPSGKPILGFEAPAHLNIFKIISIRYQKKFFQDGH